MNKDKIENLVNSVILTIEKLLLFTPKTYSLIKYYLDLLFYLIKRYRVYDKIDIYLNFVLQVNKIKKKKIRKIVRWILVNVIPNSNDNYLKSRVYYFIARVFLYLKHYNKAQNFAIKSMKYFYTVFDNNQPIHLLYYFELSLLISKLAFYRGKYVISFNLLQHLFSKLLEIRMEEIFERNLINLILEACIWMVISHLYVNMDKWDIQNLNEVTKYFVDIVYNFRNFVDIEKIKEYISSIFFKNIKKIITINQKKFKKKNKKYQDLLKLVSNLQDEVDSIPNIGKILVSLFKDYIINFLVYYPDNYKLALRYVMKASFLNYYYIKSHNFIALTKFLLFKIMNFEKIYGNLTEYMGSVDIRQYIVNNNEISEEVRKDIINKRVVYLY